MNLLPEQLELLFSSLDERIIVFSENGDYLDILSAGLPAGQTHTKSFIGKNICDVLSEKTAVVFSSKIKECIQSGRIMEYEYQISGLTNLTDNVPARTSATAHYRAKLIPSDVDGKKIVLWIAYDITEMKNLEQFSREKAVEDPAMGIYNRRFFFSELNNFFRRFKRGGNSYTVIKVSLDHGETLKDTYGLDVTDGIIGSFVNVIKSTLRISDLFATIGDEDFMILLPDTATDGAQNMGERVRLALENNIFELDGEHLTITASFGFSEVSPEDSSYDNVLNRAEIALYQAKHSGGNSVCRLNYENWTK